MTILIKFRQIYKIRPQRKVERRDVGDRSAVDAYWIHRNPITSFSNIKLFYRIFDMPFADAYMSSVVVENGEPTCVKPQIGIEMWRACAAYSPYWDNERSNIYLLKFVHPTASVNLFSIIMRIARSVSHHALQFYTTCTNSVAFTSEYSRKLTNKRTTAAHSTSQ